MTVPPLGRPRRWAVGGAGPAASAGAWRASAAAAPPARWAPRVAPDRHLAARLRCFIPDSRIDSVATFMERDSERTRWAPRGGTGARRRGRHLRARFGRPKRTLPGAQGILRIANPCREDISGPQRLWGPESRGEVATPPRHVHHPAAAAEPCVPELRDQEVGEDLGSGRIVASETEVPNMLANLV